MPLEQFLPFANLPIDARLMVLEAARAEEHVLELQAAVNHAVMPRRKHQDLCPATELSKEARGALLKSHALL